MDEQAAANEHVVWINKIIRSLNDERKSDWQDKDIDFALTGVQQMVMRNVVVSVPSF